MKIIQNNFQRLLKKLILNERRISNKIIFFQHVYNPTIIQFQKDTIQSHS